MKAKTNTTEEQSVEYKNMVDLLAVYSEASNQLAELQAEVNSEMLAEMDSRRADYAKLQETLTKTETALEVVALAHPQWFATRKSIKTPYGTVKFTKSTRLEIKNEEVSLLLIKQRLESGTPLPRAHYIRVEEALNLEALENLDDETLKSFRINRVPVENFKVEAASVDMGKAVKEAA